MLSVRVLILTQLRRSPKQRWSYGFASATVSPLVGWPTALVNDRPLITQLELQPHPEGGWYREIHRSTQAISRSDGETRSALTTIFFCSMPAKSAAGTALAQPMKPGTSQGEIPRAADPATCRRRGSASMAWPSGKRADSGGCCRSGLVASGPLHRDLELGELLRGARL